MLSCKRVKIIVH